MHSDTHIILVLKRSSSLQNQDTSHPNPDPYLTWRLEYFDTRGICRVAAGHMHLALSLQP